MKKSKIENSKNKDLNNESTRYLISSQELKEKTHHVIMDPDVINLISFENVIINQEFSMI